MRAGPESFDGARVLVAGLGATGQSVARGLVDLGARVRAVDTRPSMVQAADLPASVERLGDQDPQRLLDRALGEPVDLVVASPGLAPHHPLLAAATSMGLPIWSEIELAWQVCPPSVSWLVLTGTNGKTTTVTMLAAMLAAAGQRAPAVGNVGTSILTTVLDARAGEHPVDALAIELSSFQLHFTHSMVPVASACLNLAPDHLDWHGSAGAYAADKARIYARTTVACIYNEQDLATLRMVEQAEVTDGARAIGFTLGAPGLGQIGMVDDVIADRAFIEQRRTHAQELATLADLERVSAGPPPPHQVANALAAAALARAGGVAPEHVGQGLRTLEPAAHRRQDLGERAGVRYVNDSKATNAHAALASIAGLPDGRGIWIAGGLAKGADYGELVSAAAKRLRAVVVIGLDPAPILQALRRHAPDLPHLVVDGGETEPMVLAVRHAARLAQPGDVVLLAPAAASHDQFASYLERGEKFARAVADLPEVR